MSVREHENVARTGQRSIDYPLRPVGELLEALATDYSVPPQGPTGPFDLNFWSCAPFIFSIIPFPQVCVDDRALTISRESASFAGSLQRAGQHKGETPAVEESGNLSCVEFPLERQWQIRSSGVLAGGAPLGFSVTYKPQLHRHGRFCVGTQNGWQ